MGGLIPQSFIDEILSRVDIVDVIHERVPLRKAGRNYQALCPFHSEKTPSFTVNRDKQFYYCFGCGAHGSAIGFLMDAARLSFIEAVGELANRVGLQLPSTDRSGLNNPPQTQLYEALQSAAHFYAMQLRKHPSAPGAINYLKQRGLSGIIAAKFGLGYAPPGRDNLLKALGETSAKVQLLLRAGLVIQNSKGRYYDRFRDRIIFPIQDQRGRVVGFGGRVLDEEDRPKYLNSPETEVFHKGQMLYGVYHARKECKQLTRLLIVEGYMDVISLAQHGVVNAVATLGTALTLEHLEHAFRVAPEVIFCFDGDEAGQRAAWRALEIALPELKAGRYVGFLFLPPGEDPDTLVRKQGSGFFQDPSRLMPLSDFLFTTLCQPIDRASLEGKARLIDRAKPLISKLPPSPLQQLMVKRLAELSDLQADQLVRVIGARRSLSPGDTETGGSGSQQPSRLVKTAIKLLLHEPSLAMMVDDPPLLASLECPRVALLVSLLELVQQRPEISAGAMLERWRGTAEEDYFSQLIGEEFLVPKKGIKEEFSGAIARLRELSLKRKREALLKLKTRPDHLTPAEKEELRRTPVPAKGSKEPL